MNDYEKILDLIKKHNETVDVLFGFSDVTIRADVLFRLSPLSLRLSSEGLTITSIARDKGIDAKCDMQNGHITIH